MWKYSALCVCVCDEDQCNCSEEQRHHPQFYFVQTEKTEFSIYLHISEPGCLFHLSVEEKKLNELGWDILRVHEAERMAGLAALAAS